MYLRRLFSPPPPGVDPTTGLPIGGSAAAGKTALIDPNTGLPIIGGGLLPGGAMPDPLTGLPIIGVVHPAGFDEKGSRDADWAREAIERFHGSGSRVQPKK